MSKLTMVQRIDRLEQKVGLSKPEKPTMKIVDLFTMNVETVAPVEGHEIVFTVRDVKTGHLYVPVSNDEYWAFIERKKAEGCVVAQGVDNFKAGRFL